MEDACVHMEITVNYYIMYANQDSCWNFERRKDCCLALFLASVNLIIDFSSSEELCCMQSHLLYTVHEIGCGRYRSYSVKWGFLLDNWQDQLQSVFNHSSFIGCWLPLWKAIKRNYEALIKRQHHYSITFTSLLSFRFSGSSSLEQLCLRSNEGPSAKVNMKNQLQATEAKSQLVCDLQ